MKTYRPRRIGKMVVGFIAILMVFTGISFIGYSLFINGSPVTAALSVWRATFGAPAEAPGNADMTLTVPAMKRVKDLPVYTSVASDEATMNKGSLHVQGTGFPWETGSNVYIAGHRLGYAGTGSFLVFYDLDKVKNGDQVILSDSNGTRYTYTVFREFRVYPSDYSVTQPIPGKSIVSLQTCTLPNYTQRLIVQAELTSVA
jgi:sortase A